MKPGSITIFSHTRPGDTGPALRRIVELAKEAGVEVRLPADEIEKHGLVPGAVEAPSGDAVRRHRPRRGARGRRHDPHAPAEVRRHRGAGVRHQLRRDRLPRHGRALGARRRRAARSEGRVRRHGAARAAGEAERRRAARGQRHLVPPPSQRARRRAGVLRWRGRSSARCAATGSWCPPPPARPATTWPTAGRCWPGGWRATSSRSSPRTRSPRARWWWRPGTGWR